jgi:predicted nucleotidyltransferase
MAAPDLERLVATYGIRLLLQFGSSVTGTLHPHSDLDLAVLLERPELTLDRRAALHHELQRLFPEREVDLVVLNHADPLLLKQVTDHCRLLYGSAAELQRLALHAFKRYQDYRPYLDLERRFVARALAAPARRG